MAMSHLTDAGAEQNRISPQAGLSARSIRARWAAGTFVPSEALDLPEGAEVEIILRPVEAEATGAQTGLGRRRWRWLSFGRRRPRSLLGRRWPWLLFPQRRPWLLFGLSLLVYAACRLWGLDRFPIYFFADEAFHPVRAAELAQHGLRSAGGQLFPIYFEAAAQRWTPAFALYVHLLPVVLFGKTVVVTRATTALVSLLAALAVARLLARPFGARYWWSGVLLLGRMPAWLLHSRTGFETAMMTSFFAGFLYFYLRYRLDRPAYLFPAIILAAMTFYTYSNGQIVMGAAALLLALADSAAGAGGRGCLGPCAGLASGLLPAGPPRCARRSPADDWLVLVQAGHARATEGAGVWKALRLGPVAAILVRFAR